MKKGFVVLLKFPFTNHEDFKLRPALVVSSDRFNKGNDDIIVLAITSQNKDNAYFVELDFKDIKKGELKKKSFVRCGAVLTVEKSLILKTIAIISDEKLKEVMCKVESILN